MNEPEQRTHYIHRISFSAQERLVGAFVIIALAALAALLVARSETSDWFEERVSYSAYLRNAQGITTESPVKISGIRVGRVTDIDLSRDNRIHIRFYVLERFNDLVRVDSRAALSKLSIVGNATIEIAAGSPAADALPEGAVLPVEEPQSIDELLAEVQPVVAKVRQTFDHLHDLIQAVDPAAVRATSADLAATAANLRRASEQVVAGRGPVGRVLYDERLAEGIAATVANLGAALGEAQARLMDLRPVLQQAQGRLRQMEPILEHAAVASARSPELADQLTALTAEAQVLVARLNTAVLSVNTGLQDYPDLTRRLRLLLDAMDQTLQGVQRLWPLSNAVAPEGKRLVIPGGPVYE